MFIIKVINFCKYVEKKLKNQVFGLKYGYSLQQ